MTKFQRFAAGGRFPSTYVHPSRGEIAATDGHAFVCIAATATEARALLAECPDPRDAPPVAAAVRVWALDEPRASLPVSPATEPDAELRKLATERLRVRDLEARERLSSAERRLEAALRDKLGIVAARENLAATKADAREAARALAQPDPELRKLATEGLRVRDLEARERLSSAERRLEAALRDKLGIVAARENLAATKADAREAARALAQVDAPTGHALRVGDACVDLRLVRRCFAALGATRGTLVAASELGATLLETSRGVALVMPFRL